MLGIDLSLSNVGVIGNAAALPSFSLDFAAGDNPVTKYGFTFTRATAATYVNASGLIATAASGELRYTYDPVTLSALGVLIEEQRANLALYSEALDNAAWTLGNMLTFGAGSVANAATSPDGTANAEMLTPSTSVGSPRVQQSITVTAVAHTFSFYAKPNGYKKIGFRENTFTGKYATWDLSGSGTVIDTNATSASVVAVGGGWYRCSVTFTESAGSMVHAIYIMDDSYSTGAPNTYTYAGNGTSGAYIWGVQLELGSFPTSYIPTSGSAATRNADVLSLTGAADVVASWFNKDAGTWLVERYGSPAAIASAVCVDDGAATNRILVRQDASRVPHFIVGSTADVTGSAVVAGTAFKTAAAYAANDVSVSIGGGAVSTDATVTLPAGMTTARIGSSSAGEYANGTISRIRYYNRRLPNATLQSLTA